jgi:hypothetical protein
MWCGNFLYPPFIPLKLSRTFSNYSVVNGRLFIALKSPLLDFKTLLKVDSYFLYSAYLSELRNVLLTALFSRLYFSSWRFSNFCTKCLFFSKIFWIEGYLSKYNLFCSSCCSLILSWALFFYISLYYSFMLSKSVLSCAFSI